jgi:hypothetical protein
VGFHIVDADVALLAVISILFLHYVDPVVCTADLAHLPLVVRVGRGNAWIDEPSGEPGGVKKDEDDGLDEEEGVRALASVELTEEGHGEEVGGNKTDCEDQI